MPTFARSFGRLVLGSPTGMSLTVILPCWNGSSALTHLMSVDLPEPDGPQTTMTSPLSTWVVQSVRTWNWPYHFETLSIEIIGPSRSVRFQRITAILFCKSFTPYDSV